MLSASCWWDPSFAAGKKGDNSVIACVFADEDGKYWLHDLEYIRVPVENADNAASLQCQKVADFLVRNRLPSVRVEVNGIGRFLPGILKQVLHGRRIRAAVLEAYSKESSSGFWRLLTFCLPSARCMSAAKSGPRRLLRKCANGVLTALRMTTHWMP